MIRARSGNPVVADRFIRRFEHAAPDCLAGGRRQGCADWKGDHLGLHYDWHSKSAGTIAMVRLNLEPATRELWLGAVEVHSFFRGRQFGTRIVEAIETAACVEMRRIRLFSRFVSTGFWQRLGYQQEADPRYFTKFFSSPGRGEPDRAPLPLSKMMD